MTWMIVSRYMFSKANRHRGRTIRIMIGLALSTMIMLSIMSLMDHLQNMGIEPLRKIRSFPVVVRLSDDSQLATLRRKYADVAEIFFYKEEMALLHDNAGSEGVIVRYIDETYNGELSLSSSEIPSEGIVLPLRTHFSSLSSSVSLTSLVSGKTVRMIPRTREYTVEGVYQTRLADFDSMYVFLPLSYADDSLEWKAAFKNIQIDEETLAGELEKDGYDVTMWYESESLLYSALMLEKIIMSVLLSSLYVIILVQIVQNAAMLSSDKKKEVAALSLAGISRRRIVLSFSLIGFLITLYSLFAGLALTRIFLSLFPLVAGINNEYSIDWSYFTLMASLMLVLSSFIFGHAFFRKLRENVVVEVLNGV